MKKSKGLVSALMVICCMLFSVTPAVAASPADDYAQKVAALGTEYNVTISVTQLQRGTVSIEQQEAELAQLEERLKAGKAALDENNRQAEENWNEIVAAGRYDANLSISDNEISPRATHTVYYFQNIGYYYPGATTIRCYVTGNRNYSDFHQRYLWGSVVSNGSRLYSGMGDSWDETDSEIQRIDGGRTYYVQLWGDLEESYTSGIYEYTVTSEDWRIWYEAYCPK